MKKLITVFSVILALMFASCDNATTGSSFTTTKTEITDNGVDWTPAVSELIHGRDYVLSVGVLIINGWVYVKI